MSSDAVTLVLVSIGVTANLCTLVLRYWIWRKSGQ